MWQPTTSCSLFLTIDCSFTEKVVEDKNNLLIGLGTILLGGAILFLIRDFPKLEDGHPGPALFPGILAGLFIVFGTFLLVQGVRVRKQGGAQLPPPGSDEAPLLEGTSYSLQGILNAFCVTAAIVFYIFFVETLGFLMTGFLLLIFLMIKLKVPIWKSGIISLLSTLGVYMMFAKVLKVPLPWGLLGW